MRVPGLLAIAGLSLAAPASAGPHYSYVHAPGKDIYFGHISHCELKGDSHDPLVVANESAEVAAVNFPLAPGSRILTTTGRRCEAQFDTGTVMRLDGATGVRIETILAKALVSGDKLTNIHLETGRVHVLYRDYDSRELFQILTPNAAIKLGRSAVVDVELGRDGDTRVSVLRGGAQVLYGPNPAKTRAPRLKAGERAIIDRQDVMTMAAAAGTDDPFLTWNREMNQRFVANHEGRSALPKPIERYPRAILDFAQRYGDPYGEWLWTEMYGYVWRPYLSSDVGWRPYQQGRWVPVNAQLFWVPDEPWGWVPYHLGLWHWDTTHGWMWIPGSAFSPAWVSWSSCYDALYFRPLSLFDWNYRGRQWTGSYGLYGPGSYGQLCGGYPGYYPSGAQTVVAVNSSGPQPQPSPDTTGDKEKTSPVPWRQDPDFPKLPAEIQKVAERAIKLMAEADGSAVTQKMQESATVAQAPAVGEKLDLPMALWPPAQSGRFLDWNGDVRAARRVGGHIVYSSVNNAIRCDDCRASLKPDWQSPFAAADRSSGANYGGSSTASDGGAAGSSSSAGQRTGGGGTTGSGTNDRDRIR